MEPRSQVEIQLGHMCNNRCVFCVSGQRTALGEAPPLPAGPLLDEIRRARASGISKLTLLGGEPTLQPSFMTLVREAVALGFEEIVIFTNGAKTARASFIDEILETGGNFTFRFSVQGATEEAHDRTTRKPGAFTRIRRSMEHVAARGQRLTVNLCVVESNYESVDRFPELLLPLGAAQLHLDMLRPLDAGQRTPEEMAAMLPRYGLLAEPMRRMIRGFPEGFDVNIGNLPYCVAPDLAPWIHHDGEHTLTISIDEGDLVSAPWDKYRTKRRDKFQPEPCAACVLSERCSGVFETYAELHGTTELVPITREALRRADPMLRLFSLHVRALLRELDFAPPPPFTGWSAVERSEGHVEVALRVGEDGGRERIVLDLERPSLPGGHARTDLFRLTLRESPRHVPPRAIFEAARSLLAALSPLGVRVVAPLGEDALGPLGRSIAARLERLRDGAPFGELEWRSTRVLEGGARAELELRAPCGERAVLWLSESKGRPSGGYRIEDGDPNAPTPALVEGLGAAIASLRPAPANAPRTLG